MIRGIETTTKTWSKKHKEMEYHEHPFDDDQLYEILLEGEYKSTPYYILSYGTHPCAYIELNKYQHNLLGSEEEIDCHGGITYGGNKLHDITLYDPENIIVGWDYAHAGDQFMKNEGKKWTVDEIEQELINVIKQLP